MTNRTINQPAPTLQEREATLLRRMAHLELLIGQVKDEIAAMSEQVPIKLGNELKKLAMELENTRQDLAYLINKQEDLEQQQQNEPLIIKPEDEKR